MALQIQEFSKSVPSADGTNTFTFILRVTENSVDVAANSSHVTIQAILKQEREELCFSDVPVGISFHLGNDYSGSYYRNASLAGREEHIYYTWNKEIPHKDDGSLSFQVIGQFWLGDGYDQVPNINVGGTMELTAIQYSYVAGASDAVIGSNSTIVVSGAVKNNKFSIRYTFGNLSGYIRDDGGVESKEAFLSSKVISFPVPQSFYSQIPNKKEAPCNLQVKVYNGSSATTYNASFVVKTDPNVCRPLVTARVEDGNPRTLALTEDPDKLIRFASTATCQVEAEGQKGAAITALTVNGVAAEAGVVTLPNTETGQFLVVATDSRGYTTQLTVEKELIDYVLLTCNPVARRTAPTTGQVALTLEGNCFRGSFGAEENSLSLRYRVGEGDWIQAEPEQFSNHSYTASVLLEGLTYTQGHLIHVEVADRLNTVAVTAIVQRGIPVFDWGEDYFNFHVPVHFGAGATGLT